MLSLDHPVKTLTKCMQVPVQGEVVEAIAEGAEICQIAIPGCSMVLEYLPTFSLQTWPNFRSIFRHHGTFGV